MRARVLCLLVLAGLAATASSAAAAPSASQELFGRRLLDDPATSAGVKRLLRTHEGLVDPRSGFLDLTGDGRRDALVLVSTGGAAGTVALYVFSSHGRDAGDDDALRPILRLQTLHRATFRVRDTTLTVVEPRWRPGDDLCCPALRRERDYAFHASSVRFVRRADRTVGATA